MFGPLRSLPPPASLSRLRQPLQVLLLAAISLWLAGCGLITPTPGSMGATTSEEPGDGPPSLSPIPTVTPTATDTPQPDQLYEDEAGFRLLLPPDWQVGPAQATALGRLIALGPEPLGPGPISSTILVADAARLTASQAAEQLQCGGGCPELINLEETTVDGRSAHKMLVGADGPSPLEWYFVAHAGHLIYFTLHDPDTFETRIDLVDGMRFTPGAATPTATAPPAPTATPVPSPTRPAPTATPTLTPTETVILNPLAVTVNFLQAVYDDPRGPTAVAYLSQARRSEVVLAGLSYQQLIGIEQRFRSFTVAWEASQPDGSIVIAATLTLADDTITIRRATLIFEDGSWRIDGFAGETAPPDG